ncbi:hypothetical protein ppKF707_4362 [Metapseudomonas furukawaii]|uniref:Uncharacterized protein n=1 Tax=Metapseudomonas furukawaii TaxID=1149133 RepID=A0AAD1C1T4_METFU|nr:hypothetical protein ppKF707_4362 [Pseudomonas furukawaii]BAU75781.1 hypothetical protein KF707C_40930 [Pseudomonas furukawaii]
MHVQRIGTSQSRRPRPPSRSSSRRRPGRLVSLHGTVSSCPKAALRVAALHGKGPPIGLKR